MLEEAYELGIDDALEYIEKVARKTKPGVGSDLWESVKKTVKGGWEGAKHYGGRAGRHAKNEALATGRFARKHKGATATALGGAGAAGYYGRKHTED